MAPRERNKKTQNAGFGWSEWGAEEALTAENAEVAVGEKKKRKKKRFFLFGGIGVQNTAREVDYS